MSYRIIFSFFKYYIVNICIWIFANFLLGLLQFEGIYYENDWIWTNITYSFWSGILIGLIWGSVFKFMNHIRKRMTSYFGTIILSILTNALSVYAMVFCFYHLGYFVDVDELPKSLTELHQFYHSKMFYILLLHCFIIAFLFQFVDEMDRKLGRGVLLKFLLGRYFTPKEEQIAFLFMDLKSSTHYAEKLGHFKYSRLIQDCFNHLSKAVTRNRGSIYQFVGDEVVITWKVKRSFTPYNCIQTYLDFTGILEEKKVYYLKNYGLLPVFKAGLHVGKVMVAQVGQTKSEIAYHGDAINTASRIQGLCNFYQSNLLISEDLFRMMKFDTNKPLKWKSLGDVQIRGKRKSVVLYAVDRKEKTEVKRLMESFGI